MAAELMWSDGVPNVDACPRNGVKNWSGNPDLPKSYPGWWGTVWINYNKNPAGWASSPLDANRIYTVPSGSGFSNSPWYRLKDALDKKRYRLELHCFSYSCKIFAADYPELVKIYNIERSLEILEGVGNDRQCNFTWETPELAKLRLMFNLEPADAFLHIN